MRCEICSSDVGFVEALLPIKGPGGRLDTRACMGCANESEGYCLLHNRPKMGFTDDTAACLVCIEDKVRDEGAKIVGAFAIKAAEHPNNTDIMAIIDIYRDRIGIGIQQARLGDLALLAHVARSDDAQILARPIITYAQRKRLSVLDAVTAALEKPQVIFLGFPEEEV